MATVKTNPKSKKPTTPPRRDAKGRLLPGQVLNPYGATSPIKKQVNATRVSASRFILEEGGMELLLKYAKGKDKPLALNALQFVVSLYVPKLKTMEITSVNDLEPKAKAALQGLCGLPPEEQASKLIELYVTGTIDCSIAATISELIKGAQHVKDERLQMLLEELTKETKKTSDDPDVA